ncbi:MAG: L-histidine N(alpha)-methyltransferase [Candidatus Micrarchaeia archaeon]|jgi:uncharacterized SAM-dependent methyltransferase
MFTKKQEFEILTSLKGRGELPMKYAYMGEGAYLWDKISREEENGGIRSMEKKLVDKRLTDFLNSFSGKKKLNVVDLGCGNGNAAVPVLRKAVEMGFEVRYVPFDISKEMLELASKTVHAALPKMVIIPHELDFEAGNFADVSYDLSKNCYSNLFLFFGNTLGNFSDTNRVLSNFRDSMCSDDFFLIGTELANLSHVNLIVERYSKSDAIREILLNLPRRMGITDSDAEYCVRWNEKEQQVEIRLKFKCDAQAKIGSEKVLLRKYEEILLVRSKKYNENSITKLLLDVGFRNELLTTNEDRSYILTLIQPTRYSV